MKRALIILAVVGLFGLSLTLVWKQKDRASKIREGNRILGKVITALGGRDNLAKVKDTTSFYTLKISVPVIGLNGTRIVYQKGNKVRFDENVMGTTYNWASNARAGWRANPRTGVTDMPKPELEKFSGMAMGNEALSNPDKYGVIFTSDGQMKTIEGRQYILLCQTYKSGFSSTKMLPGKDTSFGLIGVTGGRYPRRAFS